MAEVLIFLLSVSMMIERLAWDFPTLR